MLSHTDPFLKHLEDARKRIDGFTQDDEKQRSEFQRVIREILEEQEDGYYVLGELRYDLGLKDKNDNWRVRDINRLLTRYREDRPIKDARRWAKFAIFLALIALASSLVSAIADLDEMWENLKLFLNI